MIAFLNGKVDFVGDGFVDLDVHNVGYRIWMPEAALTTVHIGGGLRLYTYQHVREDALELFGFVSRDDRSVFERLISVSGIGPKLAMQMLGAMSCDAIVAAIVQEDGESLCALPGVGKKTAQRMILELKEKLGDLALQMPPDNRTNQVPFKPSVEEDVVTALIALGYRQKQADVAARTILTRYPGMNIEDVIRRALAWLYEQQSDEMTNTN